MDNQIWIFGYLGIGLLQMIVKDTTYLARIQYKKYVNNTWLFWPCVIIVWLLWPVKHTGYVLYTIIERCEHRAHSW